MSEQHSKLSPSGAHRWMHCPGSIVLEARYPDNSSVYADEGTAAHEIAACCLKYEPDQNASSYIGIEVKVKNDDGTVRRTFTVDDDMASYVQIYVDNIKRRLEGGGIGEYEQRVDFSAHVEVPEQSGTADAVLMFPDAQRIEIHDFKYGQGEVAAAWELDPSEEDDTFYITDVNGVKWGINPQLATYALGVLESFDMMGDWQEFLLAIHQPRIGHYDEVTLTRAQLLEFANRLKAAAAQVAAAEAAVKTGGAIEPFLHDSPSACQWCKAQGDCPKLTGSVFETVFGEFKDLTEVVEREEPIDTQTGIDRTLLGKIMKRIDIIESWCRAVRSRTYQELTAGHDVPGWKLVPGKKGKRKWVADQIEAVVKKLKSFRLKQTDIYKQELLTPTQIEKLLKGNPKQWEKLQEFIEQSEGGMHVAPAADSREEIDVKMTFEDLTDTVDPNADLI